MNFETSPVERSKPPKLGGKPPKLGGKPPKLGDKPPKLDDGPSMGESDRSKLFSISGPGS